MAPLGLLSKIQPPIDQNLAKRKAQNKTRIERRMTGIFISLGFKGKIPTSWTRFVLQFQGFMRAGNEATQNEKASIKTGSRKNYGPDHKFQIKCNPKAINRDADNYRAKWNFKRN